MLALPATAFIGLSALSVLWSGDVRRGTIELLFFLLPFACLVAVVASACCTLAAEGADRDARRPCLRVRLRGDHPALDRKFYFAPDLEVSNAYTSYLRTTSIFSDASIYGRQLAVAIVAFLCRRWPGSASGLLGADHVSVGGVYFSYSQSSMVALAVSVLALGLVAGNRRDRRILVLGAVVLELRRIAVTVVTVRGDSAQRRRVGGRR